MPAGPGVAHVVVAQDVLDFLGRVRVHQEPAPGFGLQGAAWMPDGDGARLPRQDGHVGEYRARTGPAGGPRCPRRRCRSS